MVLAKSSVMVATDQLSITHGISSLCAMRFDSGPILRDARQRDRQTATSRRNSISHKTSTRRSRSYVAWLIKKRNDAFHSALINGVFVRKMLEHQIFFAFEFQPETYEHEQHA